MLTITHKGYTLTQNDYNHHFMITHNNQMVVHSQYHKPLSKEEAIEKIENFIQLQKILNKNKIKNI